MVRSYAAFVERYGPWALVAGASEGLGAEFATQLAARGLHLVLVARRQELLETLRAQLQTRYAVEVRVLALDLGREDIGQCVLEATADLEIGLLVYNAAVSQIGACLETPLEAHLQEIAVNCRAPLILTHVLGRRMVQRGRGGVLLMSSMSASQGTALVANYGATKAYNQVLAEGLWEELRGQGVDVLASLPPPVRTPGYLASAPRHAPAALEPRVVVTNALNALGKGPTTVPGPLYRLAGGVMQHLLSRKLAIQVMARATRGMYEQTTEA
jgi:short-subunit dehydrogenase